MRCRLSSVAVNHYGNEWFFENTVSIDRIQEKLYEIGETFPDSPEKTAGRLRQIIKCHPLAFDAYYHLGFYYCWKKRVPEAIKVLERGHNNALKIFPKKFNMQKDLLPWGILENRPFLRMYSQLGIAYYDAGRLDDAITIFKNITLLNPDDNQGMRELLAECYFEKDDMDSMISLCEKYKDDSMPAIALGKVLALYRKGRIPDAKKEALKIMKHNKNIVNEITSRRHKAVDSEVPGFVEVGSRHEAYLYWLDFGRYWKDTPGAVDLLKDCKKLVARNQNIKF